MADYLEISCDESGHTGSELLDPGQRYFSFASVAISDDEAYALIAEARDSYPTQMPELKAARLMRSANGRALIAYIVEKLDGHFALLAHDKLLALCGWVFEYIYEPVYWRDPSLLYQKDLHRFVAMFCYLFFKQSDADATEAIRQFQKFMRSLNAEDAPLLFKDGEVGSLEEMKNPFHLILKFAQGYRDVILRDNRNLRELEDVDEKWAMDLSGSGLWSHLNHWGSMGKPLLVFCDDSKPLRSIAPSLSGGADDPSIARVREVMGYTEHLGWELLQPIQFVDSRDCPAVQLADLIAGAATNAYSKGCPEDFEEAANVMHRHVIKHSIFPDYEKVDTSKRAPAVNWLMLYDLALRAEEGRDPYDGLADMYHYAEVSWAKGEFDAMLKAQIGADV